MVIESRQYAQQYAGLYYIRLAMLKNRVVRAAEKKWKDIPGWFPLAKLGRRSLI
jgi:hypothetical protein